jgi:hypothetical protein
VEWKGLEGYRNSDAPFVPRDVSEEVVSSCYARMLHGFSENPQWHEPRITKLKRIGGEKWAVEITQPYLD